MTRKQNCTDDEVYPPAMLLQPTSATSVYLLLPRHPAQHYLRADCGETAKFRRQ